MTPPHALPEGLARYDWYGPGLIPYAIFDGHRERIGGMGAGSMFPEYDPIVSGQLETSSPLEMWAVYRMASAVDGTLLVHVEAIEPVGSSQDTLWSVVCEDGVADQFFLARDVLQPAPLLVSMPGDAIDVERTFTLDASWDPASIAIVAFAQSHSAGRRVLQSTLALPGRGLLVRGAQELHAVGPLGGPFDPAYVTYTLENVGPDPLTFSVSTAAPWLDLTSTGGTLAGREAIEVEISINEHAGSLEDGLYRAEVLFVNETENIGNARRDVALEIGERETVYSFPMDADPNWDTDYLWQFGQPLGAGGVHGGPDPTSGHTGPNVYGYNLAGDYDRGIPELDLTSDPIDCSDLTGVTIRFWRWLGVQEPAADHAYVRASNDGEHWTTLWENQTEIVDTEWVVQELDLSTIADGSPTVYLRWTMGTTDNNWQYCGWNIDDLEILGFVRTQAGIGEGDSPGRTARLSSFPNPFNPSTTIAYELPEWSAARLCLFDASGRLVRTLAESEAGPGTHSTVWDGRDDQGRTLPSGVYFCRLDAGPVTVTRKLVLLK